LTIVIKIAQKAKLPHHITTLNTINNWVVPPLKGLATLTTNERVGHFNTMYLEHHTLHRYIHTAFRRYYKFCSQVCSKRWGLAEIIITINDKFGAPQPKDTLGKSLMALFLFFYHPGKTLKLHPYVCTIGVKNKQKSVSKIRLRSTSIRAVS